MASIQSPHQGIELKEEDERTMRRKELIETSRKWIKRVRLNDVENPMENKDEYMDRMRDLYKVELQEERKQNKVTLAGCTRQPVKRVMGNGSNVEFNHNTGGNIPAEFHGDKEVRILFNDPSYGTIKGKILTVGNRTNRCNQSVDRHSYIQPDTNRECIGGINRADRPESVGTTVGKYMQSKAE